MANCKAKTKAGAPCSVPAMMGKQYCFTHDPSTRAAQAKARKRGGLNRKTAHHGDPYSLPAEVRTLKDANLILEYTLAEILPMENTIARARVLIALFEAFGKAIETGELEARIAALENLK